MQGQGPCQQQSDVAYSCLLGVQALGFARLGRPGSATTCVPPEASQHELQSNLQMAATYAGLGVSQVKPNYDPKLTLVSAGPRVS